MEGLANVDFTLVPQTINTWAQLNGCPCTYKNMATCGDVVVSIGDGVCTQLGDCSEGGDGTLCVIDGGGHSWPGSGSSHVIICFLILLPFCSASLPVDSLTKSINIAIMCQDVMAQLAISQQASRNGHSFLK